MDIENDIKIGTFIGFHTLPYALSLSAGGHLFFLFLFFQDKCCNLLIIHEPCVHTARLLTGHLHCRTGGIHIDFICATLRLHISVSSVLELVRELTLHAIYNNRYQAQTIKHKKITRQKNQFIVIQTLKSLSIQVQFTRHFPDLVLVADAHEVIISCYLMLSKVTIYVHNTSLKQKLMQTAILIIHEPKIKNCKSKLN